MTRPEAPDPIPRPATREPEAFGKPQPRQGREDTRSGNGHSAPARPARDERGRDEADAPDDIGASNQPAVAARPGRARTADDPDDEAPARRPFYKRPMVLLIGGIVLIAAIVIGVLWWLHARQYESTDDAFTAGDVVQVSAKVAGRVQDVYVNDNDFVKQGQKLFELDPRDLQAAQQQAEASLATAKAQLEEAQTRVGAANAAVGAAEAEVKAAQTEVDRAQGDVTRYEALPPGGVSQQTLANARAALASAQANLAAIKQKQAQAQADVPSTEAQVKSAQSGVQKAEADLGAAQLQLSYTTVTASKDGYVTRKSVEPGDYLQPGQTVLSLVEPDVWVSANFKETQLASMRVGDEVDIHVDAYPDLHLHGKVQSIQAGSGAAFSLLPPENATGNYVKVVQRVPVKIVFTNPPRDSEGHLLGVGLSVEPNVKVR